jgi:N-methylhydantoinase B
MVGLDLKCEITANNVAKSRIQEMFARYGPELLDSASSEMINYSEAILRMRIPEIPGGSWNQTRMIGRNEISRIKVTLQEKDDRLIFDFTGTDPQARRGINLPYHATFGAYFRGLLIILAYDFLQNHGVFRPLEVIAPEGTVMNVQYPGPVSLNTTF